MRPSVIKSSRERAANRLGLTRDYGQKNARGSVRRPATLFPILHRVDRKPESPGEFRLRAFQLFLNALTSTSSGTCTTKPLVISPLAMGRASLAALMSLV